MDTRSYLFATDLVPGPGVSPVKGRMTGVSEWEDDVPMAFRLLLTGNPRKAASSIWDVPEPVAILGDYAEGVARLLEELGRYADPRPSALREQARAFLTNPRNERKYLVLECREVFERNPSPVAEQNERLLREIETLAAARTTSAPPITPAKEGLISRLLGGGGARRRPVDWDAYGLGSWSKKLYHQPWASDDGQTTDG